MKAGHQVTMISQALTKISLPDPEMPPKLPTTEIFATITNTLLHMRNQTASPTRPPISFWAHNLPSVITKHSP